MAYDEKLADRVREALQTLPEVEEKKMFRGITFMVNGKMCISVSGNELMCRVEPAIAEAALETNGCRAMIKNGKQMKGFVYLDAGAISNNQDFNKWVQHCLEFNQHAKSSKKVKRVAG